MDITSGTLLGGRLRYCQPRTGHRSGIEPVLLAASVPAQPGERVLEGGTGAGAALLCLACRIPGLSGTGIEHDPTLAELAGCNARANGFSDLCFRAGDMTTLRLEGKYDHAFANPPWHGVGTESDDAGREMAKRAPQGLFAQWAARLAAPLRPRGTLTLVASAAVLPDCLAALSGAGCGSPTVFPLWPRPGRAAKLVLLQAIRGGRGPARLLPGLVLHAPEGGFTEAAEAVLRRGGALPFWP